MKHKIFSKFITIETSELTRLNQKNKLSLSFSIINYHKKRCSIVDRRLI